MSDVSRAMIEAGKQAIDEYYDGTKDAPFEGSVVACYRAMRAAEKAEASQVKDILNVYK